MTDPTTNLTTDLTTAPAGNRHDLPATSPPVPLVPGVTAPESTQLRKAKAMTDANPYTDPDADPDVDPLAGLCSPLADRSDEVPNPARMYDHVLGGAANFDVDRRAADHALKVNPDGRLHAQANRAFLRRVVRHLAHQGIDQFLDLGSGVPTVDHVHQVAQRVNPDARVVYVDSDPVASAYGTSLLARDGVVGAVMVRADMADLPRILHHPDSERLLDLTRPVGVLMVAVLHFLMDDTDTAELVSAYREHTAPGSYLAISHMTGDDDPHIRDLQRLYQRTAMPFRTRTPDQITALFTGYELVSPGVVAVSDWHPDPGPDPNRAARDAFIGGLGRRPHRPT